MNLNLMFEIKVEQSIVLLLSPIIDNREFYDVEPMRMSFVFKNAINAPPNLLKLILI